MRYTRHITQQLSDSNIYDITAIYSSTNFNVHINSCLIIYRTLYAMMHVCLS